MSNQKVWFITGASKGLGLVLTKLVLSQGNKVVATSRNIEDFKKPITKIKMIFAFKSGHYIRPGRKKYN